MIRSKRSPSPEIHPRASEIRQAIADHPELDDRQIGRLLGIGRWSKVRLVRDTLAGASDAAPVQLLADDVPAASDAPATPRLPQIAVNPTVICGNCGREGTPASGQPTWCKACACGGANARAAWPPPSPGTQIAALALLPRADAVGRADLLQAYLRARARDFGILGEA